MLLAAVSVVLVAMGVSKLHPHVIISCSDQDEGHLDETPSLTFSDLRRGDPPDAMSLSAVGVILDYPAVG